MSIVRARQEEKALYYQRSKRCYYPPGGGGSTTIELEKIFWDHLDLISIRKEISWHQVVYAMLAYAPPDVFNKASFIRSALMRRFGDMT